MKTKRSQSKKSSAEKQKKQNLFGSQFRIQKGAQLDNLKKSKNIQKKSQVSDNNQSITPKKQSASKSQKSNSFSTPKSQDSKMKEKVSLNDSKKNEKKQSKNEDDKSAGQKMRSHSKSDQKSNSVTSQKSQKKNRKDVEMSTSPKDADKKFELTDILEQAKPKRPMVAYMQYSKFIRADIMKKYPNLKMVEISKQISDQWKSLSESKKKDFETLYEKDKIRYKKECDEFEEKGFFIDKNGIKSLDLMLSNPKFLRGVVLPKKLNTAYIYYLKDQFILIKKQSPKLNASEILNIISKGWKELSQQDKKVYLQKQEDDIVRHQAQMQQLLSKGYFITENGMKSTDQYQRKSRFIDETKSNLSEKTKDKSSASIEQSQSRDHSIQSNQQSLKKRSKVSNSIDLDQERPFKKIRMV